MTIEDEARKHMHRQALTDLGQLQEYTDIELAHSEADKVLCNLLVSLGYADVVEEWRKVRKWYA